MNKVLVTGGCGYIGSHTMVDLLDKGFEVISVDNLCNSSEEVLKQVLEITGKEARNYAVDLRDKNAIFAVIEQHPDIIGIIHFAALKSVEESVFEPLRYYDNNITSLINLLKAMRHFEIKNLIFSSSCSVYGNAKELPVTEQTAIQKAESPYAFTKQIGEQIIQDFCKKEKHVKASLLRYFNPAGAHPSALIGEAPTNKASNLVPVITETAIGKREKVTVFGTDYQTRDGSCIRDYIHVMDLADAHSKALQYLLSHKSDQNCEVFNLGTGNGVTVMEAIHAFEKVSRHKLNYELGPRRAGDVEAVFADFTKAKDLLHWIPTHNIDSIMLSAWEWEKARTNLPKKP